MKTRIMVQNLKLMQHRYSILLFLGRIMVQNSKLMQHRYLILLFVGRPVKKFQDIEWLRSITSLPILLKGVLTPEDAIKATEVGVDGIIVSNHGARQLDYSPATITVLEEVVVAVGGKIHVLLDGGIRRGTDIFKALALGAKAVMIGRLVLYGLAAKGEQGVRQVMQMLKNELELTMDLSGCPTLKDITRSQQTQLETLG